MNIAEARDAAIAGDATKQDKLNEDKLRASANRALARRKRAAVGDTREQDSRKRARTETKSIEKKIFEEKRKKDLAKALVDRIDSGDIEAAEIAADNSKKMKLKREKKTADQKEKRRLARVNEKGIVHVTNTDLLNHGAKSLVVYEGNAKNGSGEVIYKGKLIGHAYKGVFRQRNRYGTVSLHGYGMYTWPSGDTYEGGWFYDKY